MKLRKLLAALAAGLVVASNASATAVTIYTDRKAWQIAVHGNFVNENFDDNVLVPTLQVSGGNGITIAGGLFGNNVSPGVPTTFSYGSALSGFGGFFDLSPGGTGTGLVLTLQGGTTVSFQLGTEISNSYTAGQFFGFVSDTTFTSVLVQSGTQGGVAETYTIDALDLAPAMVAQGVPEPGSIALLGLGLAGLVAAHRRKQA